jgi:sugar phosphate isomerase/epimerase
MPSINPNSGSRREFLAAAMAATVAPAHAGNRIDRNRFSAITDEIARTPRAAVEFAQQYGLRWLELRSLPEVKGKEYFQQPKAYLEQAAREFQDAGIGISFLNTSMCKYTMPGTTPLSPRARPSDRFDKRIDELKKSIEAAHILGTNKIRVFCFMRVERLEALFPRISEILMELAEIAGRDKMTLLIENEGACNVGTAAELAKIIKMSPSKWLGVNWDPHNAANRKEVAFPDGYELLPPKRIGNVQIKGKSLLVPEERMDWRAIFRRLEKDGYKGQVGLETHIFGEIQIQKSHESIREMLRIVAS